MNEYKEAHSVLDAGAPTDNESTLLPMLLGGLILVVIGAGIVMTVF